MTQKFFVDGEGKLIAITVGLKVTGEDGAISITYPDPPIGATEVPVIAPSENHRWRGDQWVSLDIPAFQPIEPTPFWLAAFDLLQLKKSDVLNAIADENERYEAELEIEGRKTYRRDDPMVVKLAQLKGYPSEQMDTLWLYVQEHYQ